MEAIRRAPALLALLIISAIVVGCGSQTTTSTAQAHAPTATAMPTTTPSPTPRPTVGPAPLASCDAQQQPSGSVSRAGDMLIFKPKDEGLNYPNVRLPDQTQLTPLKVPVQVSNNALQAGQFPGTTPVNPGALTGSTRNITYIATICNSSASQSHVVQSVSVRIAALTPYSGQVNVWPSCDMAFSRQDPNVHTGGCGGGYQTDEQAQATFPSHAAQGTTVVATQNGSSGAANNMSVGPLPVTLPAGKELVFAVTVSVPDMAGTYAFSIGFQVDGAPATFGLAADASLAAPVAHTFTGAACNTSTMLTQIPAATNPASYYICPQ